MAEMNVGDDPINPAYYAGTACAEIIEHMPTNVGFAAKYAWRLGEKDSEAQEAGKAIWYLERQLNLQHSRGFIDTRKLYRTHCSERIQHAFNIGKLDLNRSKIIENCVEYTLNGDNQELYRAIELYRFYL